MVALDASMALAWLFEDETTNRTELAFNRVVEEGAMVPSLWRLEVANALRNAVRRKRCDENFVDEALASLGRLLIEVDEHTNSEAWDSTLSFARQHDLTLYDAAYLELAVRRKLPIATCDGALIGSARARNLEVLTG